MDKRISKLLEKQHGYGTVAQLRARGCTSGEIQGLVRRGRLLRTDWALVQAPGTPTTPAGEVMAAVLRSGRGARAVGPRVLWLLGVRGFEPDDAFGILVPAGRALPKNRKFEAFADPHDEDGSATVEGIAIPKPARCAVELARWRTDVDLRTGIDACRWARRPTTGALLAVLPALPDRYAPARAVRALVAEGHLAQESEPERIVLAILGDDFGPVECQVWVTSRRRVDLLLRALGIVLEYQGADHRTESGRLKDVLRDEELEGVGYTVVPVYFEDLAQPAGLRARLRRVVANLA